MAKLTKRVVENVRPQLSDVIVWDSELPGFGCKITPSGRRVYILYYRNCFRQQRKPSIGVHGAITCEEARKTAREWLAQVSAGKDPLAARQAMAKAPNVADLAKRYMREHAHRKKPSSAENDERYLRLYILPALGPKKVASISRVDVGRLLNTFQEKPVTGNRVLALLSKAFNLAEIWGWRPDGSNPCRHVQKFPEQSRERYLTPDELQRLGAALADVERERWDTPSIVPLVRLLIFTGCRLREIMTARWEWVDRTQNTLNLPDSKTDKKTVILTPPALSVLDGIDRLEDNPFIIVGKRPGQHLVNPTKPWKRICARADLHDIRLHDLRHSFAT